MNLIRWQTPDLSVWSNFGRLSNLRDELDRLFGEPLSELARTAGLSSGGFPALDIYEDKDNFVVTAELPGLTKEDVEVSLHEGNLSISGERKGEQKVENTEVFRSERFVGRFQRTVKLPAPVAADKIKAQYKDGLLTVTLPKVEEAKPKQIDVQVN
jgi:HSP20 family protein